MFVRLVTLEAHGPDLVTQSFSAYGYEFDIPLPLGVCVYSSSLTAMSDISTMSVSGSLRRTGIYSFKKMVGKTPVPSEREVSNTVNPSLSRRLVEGETESIHIE